MRSVNIILGIERHDLSRTYSACASFKSGRVSEISLTLSILLMMACFSNSLLPMDNDNLNLNCPSKCWPDGSPPVEDDQDHLLNCSKLKLKTNQTVACRRVQYDDIYGDVNMQKVAVHVFKEVLETRNKLMEE